MDHIILDTEIRERIEDTPGGFDATDKLGLAVACVWEEQAQRMRVYGEEDIVALRERIVAADMITTFNGERFDFPLIWQVSKAEWQSDKCASHRAILHAKSNDLLVRIWMALGLDPDVYVVQTHGGWSLDVVARATLGRGKIGNGVQAPRDFQAGHWARVTNYCQDDVMLTWELGKFIDWYGYVIGKNDRVVRIPA